MPTTQDLIALSQGRPPQSTALLGDIAAGGVDFLAGQVPVLGPVLDATGWSPGDAIFGGSDDQMQAPPGGDPGDSFFERRRQRNAATGGGGAFGGAGAAGGWEGGGGEMVPAFAPPQGEVGAPFGFSGPIGQTAAAIVRYIFQSPDLVRAVLSLIRMKAHAQGQGGPGWRMSAQCAGKYKEHLRDDIREALDAFSCGMPSVIGGTKLADEVFLALVIASQGYGSEGSCSCD